MTRPDSVLSCIPALKELIRYLFTVTENSPKKYRFTLIDRMQSESLDALTSVITANEIVIGRSDADNLCRSRYQHKALGHLNCLEALILISSEVGCILPKQYKELSGRIANAKYLIRKWMESDKRRIMQQ